MKYVAARLTRPGNYSNGYWRHLRYVEGYNAYCVAYAARLIVTGFKIPQE